LLILAYNFLSAVRQPVYFQIAGFTPKGIRTPLPMGIASPTIICRLYLTTVKKRFFYIIQALLLKAWSLIVFSGKSAILRTRKVKFNFDMKREFRNSNFVVVVIPVASLITCAASLVIAVVALCSSIHIGNQEQKISKFDTLLSGLSAEQKLLTQQVGLSKSEVLQLLERSGRDKYYDSIELREARVAILEFYQIRDSGYFNQLSIYERLDILDLLDPLVHINVLGNSLVAKDENLKAACNEYINASILLHGSWRNSQFKDAKDLPSFVQHNTDDYFSKCSRAIMEIQTLIYNKVGN
jgi:hypothetical protein